MRNLILSALMAPALLVTAAAHADTFTFTPTGGSAITFVTPSTPSAYNNTAPYDFAQYNLNNSTAYFFDASQGIYFDTNMGYGPTPFDFRFDTNGTEYLEDGLQLFTGSVSNPSFTPGTYTLVADQKEGNGIGGVLVVDGGASSVTPEPSSIALLGTGLLGVAGTLRRKRLV